MKVYGKMNVNPEEVRENSEGNEIKNIKQINQMILEEAGEVQVPEGLLPDRILNMLEAGEAAEEMEAAKEKQTAKKKEAAKKNRRNFYFGYAACAAVLLMVCGFVLFRSPEDAFFIADSEAAADGAVNAVEEAAVAEDVGTDSDEADETVTDSDVPAGAAPETQVTDSGNQAAKSKAEKEKKADAGDLYLVAHDYGEVYDVIMRNSMYGYMTDGCVVEVEADIMLSGTAVNEFAADAAEAPKAMEPASRAEENGIVKADVISEADMEAANPMVNGVTQDEAEVKQLQYSTTNLQLQGVDESDIVKTDGSFLYIVKNDQIYIVDAKDGKLSQSTSVTVPFSGSGSILELYVDQGVMIAVVQETFSKLREAEGDYVDAYGKVITEKQYITATQTCTKLYTYSLEEPMKPKLLGSVGQDGSYHTSRKIGNQVYLFTNQWMAEECYYSDRESDSWIPLAGGEPVAADCIYIPSVGAGSLLISSVNIEKPEEVYDTVMVVNDNATVYVSTDAIYLYHTEYTQERGGLWVTEIAKFGLKNGEINAVAAANVEGSVTDTFAVNASSGMLRILTTGYSMDGSNLYILDENLSVKGKLTGIAPGEDIYSARYFGDMVYFVTYRNIDPLFAVDLSDPANPEILGELKITGYSDYLHMWNENKLFGIGFETDPDTGNRKGVKLSMFDVSDPVNLKAVDTVIIKNADYTPALDQYKTVLANKSKNLIGFVVTDYDTEQENTYLLFKWEEGTFKDVLSREVGINADNIRGMYVGNYFYIVTQDWIYSHDMQNEFAEVASLELK